MALILHSDFRDYYDHWFDSPLLHEGKAQVFERLSTGGMTRGEMLASMQEHGLNVPAFGAARDLKSDMVIVYLDERSHCGNGKELMVRAAATLFHSDCLAAEYLPGNTISFRSLWVGDRNFHLCYMSDDVWRSNVGNVEIVESLLVLPNPTPLYDYPLWAIDYIVRDGKYWAVDLNIAPGLTGTPVQYLLKPGEVVELIKQWYERN